MFKFTDDAIVGRIDCNNLRLEISDPKEMSDDFRKNKPILDLINKNLLSF